MVTSKELKVQTKADLVQMAKEWGVTGVSRLPKDELIKRLVKASRGRNSASARQQTKATNSRRGVKQSGTAKGTATAQRGSSKSSMKGTSSRGSKGQASSTASARQRRRASAVKATGTASAATARRSSSRKEASTATKSAPSPRVRKKIRQLQLQRETGKDISVPKRKVKTSSYAPPQWEPEPKKDRIALFVRDPYWLHATWDITPAAVQRAKAALAEQWHGAKPVLRILRIENATSASGAEIVEQEIDIHGGVRDWYINWSGQSASLKAAIGYLAPNGRFHVICSSNMIRTPQAGSADDIDGHWADMGAKAERILTLSGGYDRGSETRELKEMLEERVKRTLGAPTLAAIGAGADNPFRKNKEFFFELEVELLMLGATVPDAYVTLDGEPIALKEDGTFVMRLPFPDRRQVLPVSSCSRDGSQQRTVVIAVEKNTKVMEPLEADVDNGE